MATGVTTGMSGSLQSSNNPVDSVNILPEREPEKTATTVSQNAVNADGTPLSDQVNDESTNDHPKSQPSETESHDGVKVASESYNPRRHFPLGGFRPSRKNEEHDVEKKETTTIPTLNRVTWPDFKWKRTAHRHRATGQYLGGSLSEKHAIDVLMGDPVIPHKLWTIKWRTPERARTRAGRRFEHSPDRFPARFPDRFPDNKFPDRILTWGSIGPSRRRFLTEPMQSGDFHFHTIPDRIRINGESLKQLLSKALKVEFKYKGPVVLLKPFKLLMEYNDHIRNLYKQLEQKFERKSTIPDASEDNQGPDRYRGDVAENEDDNSLLDRYGTDQAYKELGCLIELMDNDLKALKHFEGTSVTKIPFSELWHIFQPGDEVITAQKPINAYRVLHVTGGRTYLSPPVNEDGVLYGLPEKSSDFVVNCYQVGFDGNEFGPVAHSFSIQKYDGLRDITTLLVYPLKFAKDPTEIRETLFANGQTFLDVSRGGHVQYRGLNLHELEEIDSEIVVDFHAALWDNQDKDREWHRFEINFGIPPPAGTKRAEVTMASAPVRLDRNDDSDRDDSDSYRYYYMDTDDDSLCEVANCCSNDYVFDDLAIDLKRMEDFLVNKTWLTDVRHLSDDPNDIPKEDLILFPHQLFAFVLKDRKWAVVDINNIKKIPEPKDEAWNLLVLPKGHKAMVYSLVQAHFRNRQRVGAEDEMRADLISGKGKGLIILLHGAPGVGKTSTAECVAELCKRPLYPITCGDLGTTAEDVETRMKRIFIQAQRWKCVLLLDEADVFMSERQSDIKHNSLVSVFLRVLEYYSGILFLTTNRVGKLDEAFRSRVHISLYYPPLDEKSTVEIFRTNLVRTKTHKGDTLRLKQDEIEAFAEDHYNNNNQRTRWNGRQIRNAFHIAIALAENDAAEKAKVAKGDKKPPKPTLRAKHFQVVEEASSRFDEYLTTVLGMGHTDRAKHNSLRSDGWDPDEPKTRAKRESRRKTKRYGTSSSSDSEESLAEDSKRGNSLDASDDCSDPPSRESKSSDDTDSSEAGKIARERKRNAAKKSSRDKDRVLKPKERGKRKDKKKA